jgi:adenosylhomocysteine nucleosidase
MKRLKSGDLVFVCALIAVALLPLQLRAKDNQTVDNRPIGVISALPYETAYLISCLQSPKKHVIFARNYYEGKIGKQDVVVAQVGVGIVNASVGAAILIEKFKPKAIIMTGVAGGSPKTQPGDVIIAKSTTFYDLGMVNEKGEFSRLSAYTSTSTFSGKGEKHLPLFFKANSKLLSLAEKSAKTVKLDALEYKKIKYPAKVLEGILATTETFCGYEKMTKTMMKRTGCIAFDMEGAGPAQVCYNQKIPYILIKSVSDNGNFDMFNCLKEVAAKNAELLVESIIKKLK